MPLVVAIVEEHGTANPFVVDTSRVSYDFPSATLEGIRNDIMPLAGELRLQDGLIHTQFIKAGNQCWLIEVTRRCPPIQKCRNLRNFTRAERLPLY